MRASMNDSNISVKNSYSAREFVTAWRHGTNSLMDRVKQWRKDRGLSQAELADMVGCSQGMVSRIERGDANPTFELIESLAIALRVPPAALFKLPDAQQRLFDAVIGLSPEKASAALLLLADETRKPS